MSATETPEQRRGGCGGGRAKVSCDWWRAGPWPQYPSLIGAGGSRISRVHPVCPCLVMSTSYSTRSQPTTWPSSVRASRRNTETLSGQLQAVIVNSIAFIADETKIITRFRMVKKWFPQNTFFSWFFTGKAFIMVYYIIKLDLEFQLDLQNPLKQPKMWIFWKLKKSVFG